MSESRWGYLEAGRLRKAHRSIGQRDLAVTASTYAHLLVDGREVDLEGLLAS